MASQFVDYKQTEQLGQGPQPAVRGIPLPGVPNMPDVGAADRALSSLGQELGAVAAKLQEGQQHTLASQATETFLQKRADLQQKYVDDPDFATAEPRFRDEMASVQRDALGTISDPTIRARTSLEMTRDVIASANKVHVAQVGRQGDINIAANDTLGQSSLNDAVTAGSPQERAAAVDRYVADNQRLASAGWIDHATAGKRIKAFQGELDGADALLLVNKNPAAAVKLLNNPEVFGSLDPVKRASLTIAAQQKLDGNTQGEIVQAAAFHPEAASLSIGRVIAPDHAQKIFDNGIVSIESNGKADAVSEKGALGLAQLMPGTARDVATKLGLKDVASLSDADLKSRLLTDTALNLRLGRSYWNDMVARYDGNVALAAVAYNAGPGRADDWKVKAETQFGAGFSPGQLASVVDIKESRDYLGKLYGKFGAPMNASFSSPSATLTAANAVGAVLAQQDAREKHLLSVQATAGDARDPVADIVKQGYDVDPMRIANYRAEQSAAAAKGDAAAAGRLRDLSVAEKLQPMVRQAWATPPLQLDAAITGMEASFTAPGASPTQDGLNALKAFKAVKDEQVKRRDSEPVVLGGANGGRFYQLQPIDPSAPLDDTMVAGLKNRDAQAVTAQKIYGGSGSPFTAQEVDAWHQKYADATPAERAAIVGQFAKGLSPATFSAALPQIVSGSTAKADRPGLMMAAGLYSGAPEIASTILQGIDAENTDKRYVPSGTNKLGYQTSKDQYLPAAVFNIAGRTDPKGPYAAMADAIDARYAYLSAQSKDTSGNPDSRRLKQAVDDVTGGILRHNGAPVIAPARGMSQADFDGVVWGVTDADLAAAQTTGGKAITADYLRGSAKLQARADGQYYLQVNRDDEKPQYAVTKAGAPFVLDLRGRKPVIDRVVADPLALSGALP